MQDRAINQKSALLVELWATMMFLVDMNQVGTRYVDVPNDKPFGNTRTMRNKIEGKQLWLLADRIDNDTDKAALKSFQY